MYSTVNRIFLFPIRINKAKVNPKRQKKKLRKQINGTFNNRADADENKLKKYQRSEFFFCQKLKSRVSFIQLKPILGIFLRGSVSPAALNTV
jgi:hypothetical protein